MFYVLTVVLSNFQHDIVLKTMVIDSFHFIQPRAHNYATDIGAFFWNFSCFVITENIIFIAKTFILYQVWFYQAVHKWLQRQTGVLWFRCHKDTEEDCEYLKAIKPTECHPIHPTLTPLNSTPPYSLPHTLSPVYYRCTSLSVVDGTLLRVFGQSEMNDWLLYMVTNI